MKTNDILEQKLKEFDEIAKFIFWEKDPIYGGENHKNRMKVEQFLHSFYLSIIEGVLEEVEGMKTEKYPERYNIYQKECKYCGSYRQEMHDADCDFIIEENRNSVLSDLQARLAKR